MRTFIMSSVGWFLLVLCVIVMGWGNARAEDPKTKIVLWTWGRHDMDVRNALFEQFAKDHPELDVELVIHADRYPDMLKLAWDAEKPPDVFQTNANALLAQQVEAGWLLPLDRRITPELRARFMPGIFRNYLSMIGDRVYAVPTSVLTAKLFYNKTLFAKAGLDPERPPKTWGELRAYARQITQAGKGRFFGFVIGAKDPWVYMMNATWMASTAGGFPFDYRTGRFHYNSEPYKQVFELLGDLIEDRSMMPGMNSMDDDRARLAFCGDKAAMIIGGSWNPGVFVGQFQSDVDFGVADLPVPDEGRKGLAPLMFSTQFSISSKSKHPEEAWKVIQFTMSDGYLTEMVRAGKNLSSVPAIHTPENVSLAKGMAECSDLTWHKVYPPPPEELLRLEGPPFNDVAAGIANGQLDRDTALKDLDRRLNIALARAVREGKIRIEDFMIPDFDPMKK
ncbi:MAG: extracellular solute-binding protein [Candidatus Latescibacteria bacterium]|nr:extracellular solute-binding protein [Candidatus Latescibacterota bacterium]